MKGEGPSANGKPCSLLKMIAGKAAGEQKTAGVPSGYVEDLLEPRTPLEIIFSRLLKKVIQRGHTEAGD